MRHGIRSLASGLALACALVLGPASAQTTGTVAVTTAGWSDLGTGPLLVELAGPNAVLVYAGPAAPASGSGVGHRLETFGGKFRETFGTGGQHVYARGDVSPSAVVVSGGSAIGATAVAPFAPLRPQTYVLTAGPTTTTTPVAITIPAGATSYRARNPVASASPVTWTLAAANTTVPVIPTPYSTAGAGGVVGDKTLDPGGVEVFGLSAAQQAAGTLYWSAITPASGSGTLSITFGNGG